MSLRACPGCGAHADSGMHFRVFRCSDCDRLYCYLCRGSNGGRQCPKCKSHHFEEYDKVE